MARMWNKLMSLSLAIVLIATMVPWGPMDKAEAGVFFTFKHFSESESNPTEISTQIVDIEGSFTGVAADSITYKVEQLVGSTVNAISNGSTQPIISGGKDFMFTGVQLYEGLNRITVSGRNATGTVVDGAAYVLFGNVPIITEISLSDGRIIPDGGEPLVAGPLQPVILIKAKNTIDVTVNGKKAFSGGGESFSAENLGLTKGVNTLTIVAENAGKTYQVTRKLVYFDGTSTVYDLRVGSAAIDGSSMTSLADGAVTGKIAFQLPGGAEPAAPLITAQMVSAAGALIDDEEDATTITKFSTQGNIVIYSFATTDQLLGKSANGEYAVNIKDNWRGVTTNTRVKFKILNTSLAYIKGIKLLQGVVENSGGDTVNSVTSTTDFPVDQMLNVPSLPIYVQVETSKSIGGTPAVTVDMNAFLEGSTVASAELAKSDLDYAVTTGTPATTTTYRVFKITKLPQGKQSLRFSVTESANTDIVSRNAEYLPIPSIRLTNLANGMPAFDESADLHNLAIPGEATLKGIRGRLINFSPADYDELKLTFNGTTKNVSITDDGIFYIDPATGVFTVRAGVAMVEGPNTLTFTAISNGIPISTTVTVYYFSTDVPTINWVNPVRDLDPTDIAITTETPDPFFIDVGDRQYSTTEEKVDVLFKITNAEKLIVKIDGKQVAMAESTSGTPWAQANANLTHVGGVNWRMKADLEKTGPKTFTIQVIKGSASATETITVTRENPKYQVLSPKLPKEKLVNQNFLNISILAPGAVKIVLGKQEMTKGLNDIFRMTYTGLKPGSNRIKFTVYQSEDGKTKFDDTIVVTYAGDSSVGAQYRQTLESKMNVFNGDLSVTFPKNTYLQQVRVKGMPDNNTDLFESQEILFGIADKNDGRTVKSYNTDGTITQILENPVMRSRVAPLSHYLMVSSLYWVDAGYMKNVSGEYVSVPAEHPYMTGADYPAFMSRVNDKSFWLEPSQRGEITLKYDPDLRNVTANNVSIWRLNGLTWENIGGKVDVNKKTVTASFDAFGYYAVMSLNYSYNDIVSHGYGRDPMELLLSRGVMEAKDPNEFGAYDSITRGEFAQMLVKMANIELDYDEDVNKLTFIDVPMAKIPGTLWDYRYIETAARKGIVRGKTPRLFSPQDPLTREQAAVMIARALNLLKGNENTDKDKAALQKAFTDANLIEDVNSISSVQAIVKAGYITGIPNTTSGGEKPTFRFDPRSNLTRGDAAVITVRVMKKAKLV